MSRTVVPAGNMPVALAGMAWLVASSPNFQAWTGTASTAAAYERVSFEADDTEESGSIRPRAIVRFAPGGYHEVREALNQYRPYFKFWLSFEAYPSNTVEGETPREDRLVDEPLEFCNAVQKVLEDLKTMNGIGTGVISGLSQVSIGDIRLLAGPDAVEEVRAEGEQGEVADYFYGIVFEVDVA